MVVRNLGHLATARNRTFQVLKKYILKELYFRFPRHFDPVPVHPA